jgi:AcrR family transcriptional regulator
MSENANTGHTTHADSRERIIEAAAQVFSESGYRGATTRRIAQVAGVNEVTLFRHFGSKEELIREALRHMGRAEDSVTLPAEPVDAVVELTEFSRHHLEQLFRRRALIRTCMGEGAEHPDMLARATDRPVRVHREIRDYLVRLQAVGKANADADLAAAASMLVGSLFSDAMGRDYMPEAYPYSIEEAPGRYVRLILAAVGCRVGTGKHR